MSRIPSVDVQELWHSALDGYVISHTCVQPDPPVTCSSPDQVPMTPSTTHGTVPQARHPHSSTCKHQRRHRDTFKLTGRAFCASIGSSAGEALDASTLLKGLRSNVVHGALALRCDMQVILWSAVAKCCMQSAQEYQWGVEQCSPLILQYKQPTSRFFHRLSIFWSSPPAMLACGLCLGL